MIGCIVNMIKEEIDALTTPWVNPHVAYPLAVQSATTTVEDDKVATKVVDPTKYDKIVTTKGSTFSSQIIHAWRKTTCTSASLNVMMHALCGEEGLLPHGLTIQNAYTEMCNGSSSEK